MALGCNEHLLDPVEGCEECRMAPHYMNTSYKHGVSMQDRRTIRRRRRRQEKRGREVRRVAAELGIELDG